MEEKGTAVREGGLLAPGNAGADGDGADRRADVVVQECKQWGLIRKYGPCDPDQPARERARFGAWVKLESVKRDSSHAGSG